VVVAVWRMLAGHCILAGVLRPILVLLPEDQRFTGLSPDQLKALNAQLFIWIGLVFRSWGAFAIGLGIMVTAVASTAYRQGDRWA
jgi:hypothetical protein